MTITPEKKQKSIDLRLDGKKIQTIARTLHIARNTVKKYLREYGLLQYSYSSLSNRGPPSPLDPSTYSSKTTEQVIIEELVEKLHQAKENVQNLTNQLVTKKQDNDTLTQKYGEVTESLGKTQEENHRLKEEETKLATENESLKRDKQ
jgi:chromosome segregation ATPase